MVEIGQVYSGHMFSSVVIDGNNAITENVEKTLNKKKKYIFRLERLVNTIQEVENLGWPTKTVMKEATYHYCMKPDSTLTESQRDVLKKMKELGMIHLIRMSKDKDLDDKIMIQHALDNDSWILTGDTFRKDHIPALIKQGKVNDVNEINKRRVQLDFGPSHQPIFCLPQNLDALEATKVVTNTQNVELMKMSEGCQITLYVGGVKQASGFIPMREPVGRKSLLAMDIDNPELRNASGEISRSHFKLDWDGESIYLTDLNSTNGTKINELKIPTFQPQVLTKTDIITIGKLQFELS